MTDTRLPEPLSEAEAGDYIEDDPEAWRTWVALFREYGSKLPEMAAHLGSEDGAVDVLAGAMLSRLAGQYGLLIVRAATLDAARQAAPSREALAAELTDAMILRSLSARYLDDDGDGYGGIPFVSLDEAIRALTTDRERYAAAALGLSANPVIQSSDDGLDVDVLTEALMTENVRRYVMEAWVENGVSEPGYATPREMARAIAAEYRRLRGQS